VLTWELFQFLFRTAIIISIPTSQPKGVSSFVLGRTAVLSRKYDYGIDGSSRASFPSSEQKNRAETTALQLYAPLSRRGIQWVGDYLKR
jgi:hypothetical protein